MLRLNGKFGKGVEEIVKDIHVEESVRGIFLGYLWKP
jgi:hypothetical protein